MAMTILCVRIVCVAPLWASGASKISVSHSIQKRQHTFDDNL